MKIFIFIFYWSEKISTIFVKERERWRQKGVFDIENQASATMTNIKNCVSKVCDVNELKTFRDEHMYKHVWTYVTNKNRVKYDNWLISNLFCKRNADALSKWLSNGLTLNLMVSIFYLMLGGGGVKVVKTRAKCRGRSLWNNQIRYYFSIFFMNIINWDQQGSNEWP